MWYISYSKLVRIWTCILSSPACFTDANSIQGPEWPCCASVEISHCLCLSAGLAILLLGGSGLMGRLTENNNKASKKNCQVNFTRVSPRFDLGATI